MTRRTLVLTLLALLSLPAAPGSAEARRGGGFSRSFGSAGRAAPSRRSTWGSAKNEGYRGKGGVFGGSSRGQGFGPSLGRGGRPLLSRSQATPAARTARADTFRRQYQQPVTVINRNYYGGGWGSLGWGMHSVGIWDLFFLSTVNQLFWYHHWNDASIQRALYQDRLLQDDELRRLEGRVKELEAQGVKRDPDYLPDGVDPDLAHSKEYVDTHPAEFYGDADGERRGSGLWVLLGLSVVGLLGYGLFLRRY